MHSVGYPWKFSRFAYVYRRTRSGGLVAVLIKPAEMDRNIRVLIDIAAWYRFGAVPLFPEGKGDSGYQPRRGKINSSHVERKRIPCRQVRDIARTFYFISNVFRAINKINEWIKFHATKNLRSENRGASSPRGDHKLQPARSFWYVNEFTAQLIAHHNP